MIIAVIVSILAGTTSVISRTVNARLADETTLLSSTLLNYITGLIGSSIVCAIVLLTNPFSLNGKASLWMFTGGFVGIIFITICNATVTKISSFSMTLLAFIGQVFTGIVLDAVLSGSFSRGNLIGGIVVSIGLVINMQADQKKVEQTAQ